MDAVLENARSQLVAIEAAERLRETFRVVSLFLEDPQRSLRSAQQSREYDEHRQIKSESGRLERHRARETLLLSIPACLAISQRLNELTLTIAHFQPSTNHEDGDRLLTQILESGPSIVECAAHVSNALNVIKGREKMLQKPFTPTL